MAGELHDDIREGHVTSVFVLRVWAKSYPVGSYGRTCSTIADEIERLRAALGFYADRETWCGKSPPIREDVDGDFVAIPGLRARVALSPKCDTETENET